MLYENMAYSNKKQTSPSIELKMPTLKKNAIQRRIHKVLTSNSLLESGQPVIIAVSAGSDSISLLHILSFLYPTTKRIAVYVDHGLRPDETESEQKLVKKQAEICSAVFRSISVNVIQEKEQKGSSLEEAARTLRYQALEKIRNSENACCIAVGHTADDQAEEILLRLIRGSGRTGLSGMKLKNGHIIRPLLQEPKVELLDYLHSLNIKYCIDSSNFEKDFLRNRIRLDLLVDLEKHYNGSIRRTLLQTAEILSAEDDLLDELSRAAFLKHVQLEPAKIYLSITDFSREPLAIKRRILEKICWQMKSKPSFKKIKHLLYLCSSTSGKEIHLSGGLRAVREQANIIFFHPAEQTGYRGSAIIKKTFPPITIPGPGDFPVSELKRKLIISKVHSAQIRTVFSHKLIISADLLLFPLLLRPYSEAERFRPLGAPGNKKISRFLSDLKIPRSERHHYPVLISDGKVAAIPGLRITEEFKVTRQTKQMLLIQWLPY